MTSLGDLGKPKAPREDGAIEFGWFGTTIHVRENFSDLLLMDFAEEASQLKEDDPKAMTFLKDQLKMVIAAEDFDTFWKTAIEFGQSTEDMMTVFAAIVEGHTGRPTPPSADSSGGRVLTGTISKDDSSSPVSPLMEMDRQVVSDLKGRPDHIEAVLAAAKARWNERETSYSD